MKKTLNERHVLILELIEKRAISTQEELRQALIDNGHDVSQGTISRDINELCLVKSPGQTGQYRLVVSEKTPDEMLQRQSEIFKLAVKSADFAGNTLVIKTLEGAANAACAAFENMRWDGNVGTIAGDDTFFVLCRSEGYAEQMRDAILRFLRQSKGGNGF
ncbi:MAG: arginine repressor [Oscillospiraceae bacterium]|nr:arginine repressor [Oscillospiraceae bacterium]